MIFDNLKNKERYRDLPWLYKLLDGAEKYFDPSFEKGSYPIDERSRAVINPYNTEKHTVGKFENHRDFIDVQLVAEGFERILVADKAVCTVTVPFDAEKDVEFMTAPEEKTQVLHLSAGDFAVLYPDEAHNPGITDGIPSDVRKVIFKVKA